MRGTRGNSHSSFHSPGASRLGDGMVQQLVDMGFADARENARVLQRVGNDVNAAVDELTRLQFFREQQQAPAGRTGTRQGRVH